MHAGNVFRVCSASVDCVLTHTHRLYPVSLKSFELEGKIYLNVDRQWNSVIFKQKSGTNEMPQKAFAF